MQEAPAHSLDKPKCLVRPKNQTEPPSSDVLFAAPPAHVPFDANIRRENVTQRTTHQKQLPRPTTFAKIASQSAQTQSTTPLLQQTPTAQRKSQAHPRARLKILASMFPR